MTGPVLPDALLGPFAALAGAIIIIGALWREDRRVYKERITELREQRDLATVGWSAQTAANVELVAENRKMAETNAANAIAIAANGKAIRELSAAWRERTRSDNARRRLKDDSL